MRNYFVITCNCLDCKTNNAHTIHGAKQSSNEGVTVACLGSESEIVKVTCYSSGFSEAGWFGVGGSA